jgi:hypothetical protein
MAGSCGFLGDLPAKTKKPPGLAAWSDILLQLL